MKLRLKDIIIISIVTVVTFPILYFVMIFATGNARIEFSSKKPGFIENRQKMKFLQHSNRRDSLMLVQSQTFIAAEKARKEAESEKEQLEKQQERINMLTQELEQTRKELAQERERFEQMVAQTDELEMKRIKQLAKVYGAMRADEAAQILETLDDNLLIKIINAISDDRQKAKIMSGLSKSKAARISKKMGITVGKNNG
jgi:flagellar motility protein MotE (MotC chaperone)